MTVNRVLPTAISETVQGLPSYVPTAALIGSHAFFNNGDRFYGIPAHESVPEGAPIPGFDVEEDFTRIRVGSHKIACLLKLSEEFALDADFDLKKYISERMGQKCLSYSCVAVMFLISLIVFIVFISFRLLHRSICIYTGREWWHRAAVRKGADHRCNEGI